LDPTVGSSLAGVPLASVQELLDPAPGVADPAFVNLSEFVTGRDFGVPDTTVLARALLDALGQASNKTCARILILLGILTEREDAHPAQPSARMVVLGDIHSCLRLVSRAQQDADRALRLALFYLLAHFPEEADRICDAVRSLPDPDAQSRLRRSLKEPDLSDPATADEAGRSWPSPAVLAFTAEELATTAATRRALPANEIAAIWRQDTLSLLAYAGAYASAMLDAL
jgi:hypothetical protein